MAKMPNPFVFTKKTAFMQRIADHVRSGHHRYVQGEIPIDKAAFLVEKFSRLYDVELSRLECFRLRQRGYASARLLLWQPSPESASLVWILMVTGGEFKVGGVREHWRDPTIPEQRVVIEGYELVRVTKPGKETPAWTWRYTRKRQADIREAILASIRHRRDEDLKQIIHSLWRSPGFSGIRDQVKKFRELIRSEWKRSRAGADAMPEVPAHLGYVRRLPDTGKKLSELRKAVTGSAVRDGSERIVVGQDSDAV